MESKQEEKFVLKQAEEELKKKQEEQKQGEKKTEEKKEEKAEQKKQEKTVEKKEEKPEEKKREIVLERLYTIPLKRVLGDRPRMKRHTLHGPLVRKFAAKHFKTDENQVRMHSGVSIALTKTGKNKMLAKLKVKISKDKEGRVLVELAE